MYRKTKNKLWKFAAVLIFGFLVIFGASFFRLSIADDEQEEEHEDEHEDEHDSSKDTSSNSGSGTSTNSYVDISKSIQSKIIGDSDGDGILDPDDPHPEVAEIYIVKDEDKNGIVDYFEKR